MKWLRFKVYWVSKFRHLFCGECGKRYANGVFYCYLVDGHKSLNHYSRGGAFWPTSSCR